MRTAFTDLVGCEVPIQLAPMGAICTPELVTAVVGAGAMGMTSMPGAPAPAVAAMLDALGAQVEGPFGFNVLIPFLDADVVDVAAARCRYVDFYHGPVDASLVARVHEGGALAGWQVGAVDQAVQDGPAIGLLEIQHDPPLGAVVHQERVRDLGVGHGGQLVQAPVLVALRRLDLDHVGTEVGQHGRGRRDEHHRSRLHHADAVEQTHSDA